MQVVLLTFCVFRNVNEMAVTVVDPNRELMQWLEIARLKDHVYSKSLPADWANVGHGVRFLVSLH